VDHQEKVKYISKTSYMAGLDCHLKLWQLLWDRDSAGPRSGMAQLTMDFGVLFGEIAHCLYPDAVLIKIDKRQLKRAEDDTIKAIKGGAKVVLEATFRHKHCRVVSDVVEKQPDGSWHLIEVKSSTYVKDDHIPDLAYQKWVMEQCGYPVSKCSVVFADKSGIWPDKKSIFQYEDVTDRVDLELQAVPDQLAPMLKIAKLKNAKPKFDDCVSKKCHKCDFKKTVCWTGISEPTIYDVVRKGKIPALKAQNVFYVKDVPSDFKLGATDRKHVDCMQSKSVNIDHAELRSELDKLEFPIYFLDFETVSVAVPLFDGNHSWEKLPFQYSLHVLEESGELSHLEFLHEENSDPTESLANRLVAHVGKSGSIVVYHARMESGVLNDLAERFPQHADALSGMNERIWDLEKIFLKPYRHWRFGTKSSIKDVLPVLVPELNHANEPISDGGEASLKWIELLKSEDADERQEIVAELKSYCHLDTFGMVKLLEHVQSIN
jgi:hypothetical protein